MITVVVGSPFSGKGRFVSDEIERREQEEGELGLVAVDFTPLFFGARSGLAVVLSGCRSLGFWRATIHGLPVRGSDHSDPRTWAERLYLYA